jgi:hypothetical protein
MVNRRHVLCLAGLSAAVLYRAQAAEAADDRVVIDKSYGVKGDGATNDRAALQAALDASVGRTLLITGQCRIDVKGLDIRSGSHVSFAPGASISLLPHTSASYQMLRVWDARDVLIENAFLDGQKRLNRTTPDPKGGGFGMGISLAGSTNIRIVAPVTNDCWGDGIYIANSYKTHAPSSAIHVSDHRASGCRRQGVSIISGRDIMFERAVWENIGGTLPSAGLDLEPNSNADVLENIRIVQPVTRRCAVGILVYLPTLAGKYRKEIDVRIVHHRDEGSTQAAFCVYGVKGKGGVTGKILSQSPTWVNAPRRPFISYDADSAGPAIEITDRTVER